MKKLRKNCIICEREINRKSGIRGHKERRSKQSLTCSRKCSKIYTRIQRYVHGRLMRKKK